MPARMLRFVKAPIAPPTVLSSEWKSEWIGMEIGYDLPFHNVGYLADIDSAPARVWSATTKQWITPTSTEVMGHFSSIDQWRPFWVIKRTALEYVCSHKEPNRPIITAWLREKDQLLRDTFLVPRSMVEILS